VCKYFSLCVVCVIIFLKKKFFALCDQTNHVHSNADTGLHSNSLAFVRAQSPISHTHSYTHAIEHTLYVRTHTRACVRTHLHLFERRAHFTHTHTQHECDRTHVRTFDHMRSEPSCDLFLGHFPLFPFHFSTAPYTSISPISVPSSPKHTQTTTLSPPANSTHHRAITPRHRRPSHHAYFFIFPFLVHFLTNPNIPKILISSSVVNIQRHNFISGVCLCHSVLVFFNFCRGLG
jgi:hypothetical protein